MNEFLTNSAFPHTSTSIAMNAPKYPSTLWVRPPRSGHFHQHPIGHLEDRDRLAVFVLREYIQQTQAHLALLYHHNVGGLNKKIKIKNIVVLLNAFMQQQVLNSLRLVGRYEFFLGGWQELSADEEMQLLKR
ncbi:MAG: hypothetical protein GXO35_00150 [Gammaproteobacteria bacterium]|nr:hypothetical protein [Gammaproteobacteria bacterium]